ncbi:MAG: 50S ribosomal protein L4 [Bdellovibrionota bacterium]
MAKLDVLSWNKSKVGTVELSDEIIGREVNKTVLFEVVRWQLASRRQGTAMTKTKGLVSGGGKKPFKQKGTGNARQGSTRSPLMPGGGTIFGPEPRDYSYALPKKVRRLGLSMALSFLHKEGRFFVIDKIASSGKTKDLTQKLKGLGLEKTIIVDGTTQSADHRAAKNNPKLKYISVDGLNVYDLLRYNNVIVTQGAIEGIEKKCKVEVER